MHRNSELLFKKYALNYFFSGARVLEVGPDGNPSTFQKLAGSATAQWDTLDLSRRNGATIILDDPYRFPIRDNAYDVVISGQVIEHVKKIWLWIKEPARVCKQGGHVITIGPLSWPFHEHPVDCWRFYPEALRTLYEEARLETIYCSCETLELSRNGKGVTIEDWTRGGKRISGYKIYPGIGKPERFSLLRKLTGWPTPVSFDTIAIGRKK